MPAKAPDTQKEAILREEILKDVRTVLSVARQTMPRDGFTSPTGKRRTQKISHRIYRQLGGQYKEWVFYRGRPDRKVTVPGAFTSFEQAIQEADAAQEAYGVEEITDVHEAIEELGIKKYKPGRLICLVCDEEFDSWDVRENKVCSGCKYVHGTAESTVTEGWLNAGYADRATHSVQLEVQGGAFARYSGGL